MFYVYVLHSEHLGQYYVGQTSDLRRRFKQHKTGESIYTKRSHDWNLVYYEAYTSRSLAMKRESRLKPRSRAFQELIKRIVDESGEG
jgi:putative endonuclease